MPPRATALIFACATGALAIEAQAIGFGRLSTSAVLGQPLSLPIPLRLDPGERIEPECVSAEISVGDVQLNRDRVRVRLEPSGTSGATWVARVTTLVPIDEPVLDITLTVGCDKRFSRRFVAFADPPVITSVRAAPIEPETVAAPASGAVPLVANEAGPTAEAPARRTRIAGSAATRQPVGAASQSETKATSRATKSARRRTAAAAALAQPSTAAATGGARLLLEADGPRLKLDMEEPIFMPPPLAADNRAASVPESDASAVTEADRLRLLEKALADLQRESQAGREAAGALKARLAEAENRGRAVPWLVGLVLLAVGIAAWLALRSRRHHHPHGTSEVPPLHWWSPESEPPATVAPVRLDDSPGAELSLSNLGEFDEHREAADTSPLPAALALERDLPAPGGPSSPRSATAIPSLSLRPESIHERTMVISGPPPIVRLDHASSEPVVPAREVSVEELLDLEQQADFFIALGQEEAAIDLLMAHLRSTGGLSPLPYTKLLEIYRRQGDRDAYERIRTRFNRRFNAYAPEWEDGPLSGRALEDYPEVVQHLQSLWPGPLDAMAMLEAMLFRKDAAYELFDLPAYKDVLVLYALARDLWQQGGGRAAAVDVLLPLGDGTGPDAGHGTGEPAPLPAEVPPFELTTFALPPQSGQAATPPSNPPSSTNGSGAWDTEPTLDPARRPLR